MRKKALLLFIVIVLSVAGFFLTRAFAETLHWQSQNTRPFQAEPNPLSTTVPNKGTDDDVGKSDNSEVRGFLYNPMNPDYQTEYYWYSSPHDDSWSNAVRNWCCK